MVRLEQYYSVVSIYDQTQISATKHETTYFLHVHVYVCIDMHIFTHVYIVKYATYTQKDFQLLC